MNRSAVVRLVVAGTGVLLVAGCQTPNTATRVGSAIYSGSVAAALTSAADVTQSPLGATPSRSGTPTAAAPASVAATAAAAAAPSVAPSAQGPACAASVSNPNPVRNSTVDVLVDTVANATVSAAAHYKTTTTAHAAAADATGHAAVRFNISTATVGFTVVVHVMVGAGGQDSSCDTSFTPVAIPASAAPSTPGLPPIQVTPNPVPPNAVGPAALCRDGTYSYAAHHQGACSGHGGVAVFYR
jgi:hypothetical protein